MWVHKRGHHFLDGFTALHCLLHLIPYIANLNRAFVQGTYLYVTDTRISLTRMPGLHLIRLFNTGNGEGILPQYLIKQSQGLAMLITAQILGVSLHAGHHLHVAVILLQLVNRC